MIDHFATFETDGQAVTFEAVAKLSEALGASLSSVGAAPVDVVLHRTEVMSVLSFEGDDEIFTAGLSVAETAGPNIWLLHVQLAYPAFFPGKRRREREAMRAMEDRIEACLINKFSVRSFQWVDR